MSLEALRTEQVTINGEPVGWQYHQPPGVAGSALCLSKLPRDASAGREDLIARAEPISAVHPLADDESFAAEGW